MKILIVDNDPANLDVLTIAMEMEGFEVSAFSSGEGFIEEVDRIMPDIVLLDIDLGSVDGRDLCLAIKTEKSTEDIPVIMVSAASESKVNASLGYRADAVVPKPFDLDRLVDEVKRLGA